MRNGGVGYGGRDVDGGSETQLEFRLSRPLPVVLCSFSLLTKRRSPLFRLFCLAPPWAPIPLARSRYCFRYVLRISASCAVWESQCRCSVSLALVARFLAGMCAKHHALRPDSPRRLGKSSLRRVSHGQAFRHCHRLCSPPATTNVPRPTRRIPPQVPLLDIRRHPARHSQTFTRRASDSHLPHSCRDLW